MLSETPQDWLIYVWATTLVLLNTFWLFLVVLQLPGNWLMVLSTVALEIWQRNLFSIGTLVAVTTLALLSEVIENVASLLGARKAGASRWGSWGGLVGAFIGGIAGTFLVPVPIIGSLVGACVGAASFAFLLEYSGASRPMEDSLRSGLGAGVGRLAGSLTKLLLGAAIWLIVAVVAFWP